MLAYCTLIPCECSVERRADFVVARFRSTGVVLLACWRSRFQVLRERTLLRAFGLHLGNWFPLIQVKLSLYMVSLFVSSQSAASFVLLRDDMRDYTWLEGSKWT